MTADMEHLIDTATSVALHRGFNLKMHATTILFMGSETAEALEHVTPSGNEFIDEQTALISQAYHDLELYRRTAIDHQDHSVIIDERKMVGELADQVIRIFSYCGANGLKERLMQSIVNNLMANIERPWRHGKGF